VERFSISHVGVTKVVAQALAKLSEMPTYDFEYLLVDEAQDCSLDQFQLLRALIARGVHVVCVGDAQQCIYSFQKADPSLLLALSDETRRLELLDNHRSTETLVRTFNLYAKVSLGPQALEQKPVRGTGNFGAVFSLFKDDRAMYAEISRLRRERPMLTALLLLSNDGLEKASVQLFLADAPAICFSAARSNEFDRVPEKLRCAEVLQILTIWGAKGFEFDRVFVLGAACIGDAFEDDERARLMYVAMTRAKEELYFFSVRKNDKKPHFSRFLTPLLPPELVRDDPSQHQPPLSKKNEKIAVRKLAKNGLDLLSHAFEASGRATRRDVNVFFADHTLSSACTGPPHEALRNAETLGRR